VRAVRRPRVVAHVAVSVDGCTVGFEPDQGRFYELARRWDEDVTLVGADTILAQEPALAAAPRPGPAAHGPLLAVVDGRGRVREWAALREVGHWSDVLALHAAQTPPRPPGRGVPELVTGTDRVDLGAVLDALAGSHGAGVVRVDSGGALLGALLAADLLDELSLLVHPLVVGGTQRWFGSAGCPVTRFALAAAQPVGHGIAWLHYRR
jgi:2,5-diamino-6-(ribosylamino)-4(3H)-pyrimidinone 5'-phosphate reductase